VLPSSALFTSDSLPINPNILRKKSLFFERKFKYNLKTFLSKNVLFTTTQPKAFCSLGKVKKHFLFAPPLMF
jgi:hypothetical protein